MCHNGPSTPFEDRAAITEGTIFLTCFDLVPPLVLTLIGLISMENQSKLPMFEGGIVFFKLEVLFKPQAPALKTFCTVIGSVISRTY